MALTTQQIAEINRFAGHYRQKSGAAVEALKLVQRSNRWISNVDLAAVAALLNMSPDSLEGVATFHNLIFRRPVGRHVILVCDSVSCWIMGCTNVGGHLRRRLGVDWGGTTPDDRFTLLPIVCLGACDHAPTLMIDADLHADVTASGLDRILEDYP